MQPCRGHGESRRVRFALVDEAKKDFPVHRLCQVLGVSQSGYFAWKDRPASKRQHGDMVMLAHVGSAFALSNGTYGSPGMTRELKDDGFAIGRRRTARLMRENGLAARQKRRFKALLSLSKGGQRTANIAGRSRPTSSIRISPRRPRTRNGAWTSHMSGRGRDSSIWQSRSICSPAASSPLDRLGRAVGNRLHRNLALAALRKALTMRRPPEGLIHHSDRGSQGGFNRLSQRFEKGGGRWISRSGVRTVHPVNIAVAGAARGRQSGRA